jgi:uncharacterized protein YndB with AHSA1/START domain
MTVTNDTVLEITRLFDAPPARVFDAWMTREEWQAWIGPEGVQCEVPLLEARVGGRYQIKMGMSDGQVIPVGGVFKAIEAPNRIVFTWGWDGDPTRESLITLTFRDKDGKTEMTLRQEGLGSAENRDGHGKGWNSAFNKLERYVATGRA